MSDWILILGCSTGFGGATARKLAEHGYGITANCIQARVTPTRALTKISDQWEEWVEKTKKRNPMGRTTLPEDVANVVYLLLQPEADFINCSIIHADGGEHRPGILVS